MHKKLSNITLGYGAYIIISAAFMLQVRNFLFPIFGDNVMNTSVKLVFVLLGLLSIWYAVRKGFKFFKVIIILVIFVLAYMFSVEQPYFSERTHVLTYGLLGFLALKDLFVAEKKILFRNLILGVIFTALISGSDELFQSLLPYRVCDFRDFVTNDISAIFGMVLLLTFNLNSSR